MWQLRRIRLESVGVSDARFAPLEMKLADEFDSPTDTVLWLENGGGKSTLLGLIMSVVRPPFREFLGQLKTNNHLYEYVRDDDTAHVILEWARPVDQQQINGPSHELLVTGQVLQWRDLTADHEHASDKLQRAFYGFRANAGLNLDTLPISGSAGRLRLSDYVDRLRDLIAEHRPVDHFITRQQHEWGQWLSDTARIDPEVFRYQVEMNADEGAIDEAFEKLDTEDAFVRWTLDVVTDDRFPAQLASQLKSIRRRLEQQPLLELEAEFCGDEAALLDNVADAHELAEETREQLTDLATHAAELAARLNVAASDARRDAAVSEEEAAEHQAAADDAGKVSTRLRRQASTAEELACTLAVAEAAATKNERQAAADQATRLVHAWDATTLTVDVQRHTAEVRHLEAELAKARDDVQPLLDELAGTRAQLAAKIVGLRARADQQQADAHAHAAETNKDIERHVADAKRQADAALTLHGTITTLDDRLEQFDTAVADARSRGVLGPQETAAAARERHDTAVAELADRERAARQSVSDARLDRDEVSRQLFDATQARQPLQTAAETAAENHRRFQEHIRRAAESASLQEAAATGGEPVETELLLAQHSTLAARLDDLLAATQDTEAQRRLDLLQDRRFVEAVDAHGRVPVPADIDAALFRLRHQTIPAVSGWQYLADAVEPRLREQFVRRAPDMAAGVIVQDPARFEEACAALAEFTPTSGPVTITLADTFLGSGDPSEGTFVVPAPAGLYDTDAAQQEAAQRRQAIERHIDELAALTARVSYLRDGAAELRQLVATYGPLSASQLSAAQDDTAEKLSAHDRTIADLEQAHTAAVEQVEQAEKNADGAAEELQQARPAAAQASTLADTEAQVSGWRENLSSARARFAAAKAEEAAAHDLAEEARAALAGHHAQIEQARSEAGRHTERLRDLGLSSEDAGDTPMPPEPVEVLTEAYRGALTAYNEQRSDLAVEADLDAARKALTAASGLLDEYDDLTCQKARHLLADVGVDNATERSRKAAEAADEKAAAEKSLWQAEQDADVAAEQLRQLDPSARRSPLDDGQEPSTATQARTLHTDLLARAEQQRSVRNAAEQDASAANTAAERAHDHARQLMSHVNRLVGDSLLEPRRLLDIDLSMPDGTGPYEGTAEQAETQVHDVAANLRELTTDLGQARALRKESVFEVTNLAQDRRYNALAEHEPRDNLISRLTSAASLAPEARRLAAELRARKATIDADLADIDTHRDHFVEQLGIAAEHALDLLSAVSRTRLPKDGLDDWSDKSFMRITYPPVPEDPTVVTTRLQELLSRLIGGGVSEKSEEKLGRRLVYEAAQATVGGNFQVSILKPRAKQLRYEPVPVTHLAKFSGGQRVTAAIVIFATLVSMRARAAGHTGRPRSVLILDNPVGKSSADTFVNLQRVVAAKTGVQLVYATGVNDLGALGQFTQIVRLDGKQNVRTRDTHLVEDKEFTTLHAVELTRRDSAAPSLDQPEDLEVDGSEDEYLEPVGTPAHD